MRNTAAMAEALLGLKHVPTALICSAHDAVAAMDQAIAPVVAGQVILGLARTVATPGCENSAIHRAIALAQPGDVLVVDAMSETRCAHFGEILAAASRQREVAGLVIDGAVRDVAIIRDMLFPVYARGSCPKGPGKRPAGTIDSPVSCGGVEVHAGDIVAADDDGVIVIPANVAPVVAARVKAVIAREAGILALIAKGISTCDIFGIPT